MDDLISRKVAMDTFMERPYDYYHTSYIVGELNCIPSVPAVPLDKLCEWLNQYDMPCEMCEEYLGCSEEHCDKWDGAWKMVLNKWMEETKE